MESTTFVMLSFHSIRNIMQTELEAIYDARQSFYGKAIVSSNNGVMSLWSYGKLVATIYDGQAKVYSTHSATTLRHIKEFLRQNGYHAATKAQIERDYVDA